MKLSPTTRHWFSAAGLALAVVASASSAGAVLVNPRSTHEFFLRAGSDRPSPVDFTNGFTTYNREVTASGDGAFAEATQDVTVTPDRIDASLLGSGQGGSATAILKTTFTIEAPAEVRLSGSATGGNGSFGGYVLLLRQLGQSDFLVSVNRSGVETDWSSLFPNPIALSAGSYEFRASAASPGTAAIDVVALFTSVATLAGDYNGDGFVSQGDLDLVLLNWGDSALPSGFDVNGLDGGPFDNLISQNELDGVLLNWGNGTAPNVSIPEPATASLLSGLLSIGLRRNRR